MNNISREQLLYLKRQKTRRAAAAAARFLILAGFLLIWEVCARAGIIDSFIFSSPSKIARCFSDMLQDGSIIRHMSITLYETIVSFLLVTAVSLAAAVGLWLCPRFSDILEPYLVVLNSLPKSALAPLLIVWLGTGMTTIIAAGMSVALFGSILTVHTSFRTVDPEKIKLIYTLRGTPLQALTRAVIPSCVPSLISLMKVNIGLCLVGVVIGEFLAAREGLGYLIIYSSQTFKLDWLILSILLLCIMALALYGLTGLLERYCIRRRKEQK